MRLLAMLILVGLLAACGSIAETRPTFEPTMTSNPRLVLEDEDEETTAETEDNGAVAVAPTLAPTATAIPPTSTPTPEPTAVPTEEPTPTVAPTEAPTEVPGVEVNGLIGDPDKGFEVFNYFPNPDPNAAQKFCAACHAVEEPVILVGPYLYGIASRAHGGDHSHGDQQALIDYLYESIVDPNAQIAEPQIREDGTEAIWSPGLMPQNWDEVLSDQQIADLVAYLLTLTQE